MKICWSLNLKTNKQEKNKNVENNMNLNHAFVQGWVGVFSFKLVNLIWFDKAENVVAYTCIVYISLESHTLDLQSRGLNLTGASSCFLE